MTDTPWHDSLTETLSRAWDTLTPSPENRGLDARLATLATIGPDGFPAQRQLMIRDADRAAAQVTLFTDSATPKSFQIAQFSGISLLFWSPVNRMQIRLTGSAQMISGESATQHWHDLPPVSRENYGVTPVPGTPIPGPDAYARTPDPARFALIRITARDLDVVTLSEPTHRRALYHAADGWEGQWVAP